LSAEDSSDEDVAGAGVHDADVLSEVSPYVNCRVLNKKQSPRIEKMLYFSCGSTDLSQIFELCMREFTQYIL